MQYCHTATILTQPASVDDIEMIAKQFLLKDIYEFCSSGSTLGDQYTLKENRLAYTR